MNDEQRAKWNSYNRRYTKDTYYTVTVRFNKNTEAKYIDFIKRNGKLRFIKQCVKDKIDEQAAAAAFSFDPATRATSETAAV